jgi:hypothetical protein
MPRDAVPGPARGSCASCAKSSTCRAIRMRQLSGTAYWIPRRHSFRSRSWLERSFKGWRRCSRRDPARLSAGTVDQLFQPPSIGLRERTDEALDRLEHDSPLRLGLDETERAERQLRPWRNPNTELWVIPHPLARMEAGGRSSAAGTSPISAFHVPRNDATSVQRSRLECRQKSYGPRESGLLNRSRVAGPQLPTCS